MIDHKLTEVRAFCHAGSQKRSQLTERKNVSSDQRHQVYICIMPDLVAVWNAVQSIIILPEMNKYMQVFFFGGGDFPRVTAK